MYKDKRIADLEQQLAEAQAEVERLNKLHAECPAAQAMEYRRGMERAAEIVENSHHTGGNVFDQLAHAIRAEIDK